MTDDESFRDIKNPIVRWLVSQGVVSFLLVVIIMGGGYAIQWVVRDAVPAHLKMIQDGYRASEESHEKQLDKVIQAFEREMDRQTGSRKPVAHSE